MRAVLLIMLLAPAAPALAQNDVSLPPLPGNARVEHSIPDTLRVDRTDRQAPVAFFFADDPGPAGEELGALEADTEAVLRQGDRPGVCRDALETALTDLAAQARAAGADAVLRISSDPVMPEASNRWSYLCDQGRVQLSGVAVRTTPAP